MKTIKNKDTAYPFWMDKKGGRPKAREGPPAETPFVLPPHQRLLRLPAGHRWRQAARDESEFALLLSPNGQPVCRLHSDLADNEIGLVLR